MYFNDDTSTKPTEFKCTSTYWNEIRLSLVSSFIGYLSFWIKENENKFIQDKNFQYNFYQDLIKLHNEFKEPNTINESIKLFLNYKNALSCFNFNGILKLINKEDQEAYYSFGDAYDILYVLNEINDYTNDYHTKAINNFKTMLEYSIEHKKPICIS